MWRSFPPGTVSINTVLGGAAGRGGARDAMPTDNINTNESINENIILTDGKGAPFGREGRGAPAERRQGLQGRGPAGAVTTRSSFSRQEGNELSAPGAWLALPFNGGPFS